MTLFFRAEQNKTPDETVSGSSLNSLNLSCGETEVGSFFPLTLVVQRFTLEGGLLCSFLFLANSDAAGHLSTSSIEEL